MTTMLRICGWWLLALAAFSVLITSAAQDREPKAAVVYVIPIEGVVDLGLAPYVRRILQQAQDEGAAAVVLEINTFGGRVDAAVQIRDAVLTAPVQTIAFVNKRAISAGALIALSAEKIVMARGGTIGAATPVQVGQQGAAQPVDEKTVSYVRKEFRATAESRKRPPLIAEAMVDADVTVPGVIEKGKLLTLTTDEALAQKIADFRADSLEDALAQLGLAAAGIRQPRANWAENVVRFLTHPVVSSMLITIALLGIIVELRTPGFGVPGGIGILSLVLFFWGHWLVQLAGWEELLLVVAGILLLGLEIFVIPGFGIAGVLGTGALLGGLILSMTGAGANAEFVLKTAGRVVSSLVVALLGSLVLLRFLPRLPVARRLVLETDMDASKGYTSAPETDRRWLNKTGLATSPLRPAGVAQFDGERVDVVSEGELIESGEQIKVIRVDGNRIVVRRLSDEKHIPDQKKE